MKIQIIAQLPCGEYINSPNSNTFPICGTLIQKFLSFTEFRNNYRIDVTSNEYTEEHFRLAAKQVLNAIRTNHRQQKIIFKKLYPATFRSLAKDLSQQDKLNKSDVLQSRADFNNRSVKLQKLRDASSKIRSDYRCLWEIFWFFLQCSDHKKVIISIR